MAKTKFSIEGAFEQLEDIIEQLSSEEISLSDSMDLYKKGVKILDKCSQTLDKTQKEIIILQEGQNDAIHKVNSFRRRLRRLNKQLISIFQKKKDYKKQYFLQ